MLARSRALTHPFCDLRVTHERCRNDVGPFKGIDTFNQLKLLTNNLRRNDVGPFKGIDTLTKSTPVFFTLSRNDACPFKGIDTGRRCCGFGRRCVEMMLARSRALTPSSASYSVSPGRNVEMMLARSRALTPMHGGSSFSCGSG